MISSFEKKGFWSSELISFLVDELKSRAYDDVDE
jgi:hypothetical protein